MLLVPELLPKVILGREGKGRGVEEREGRESEGKEGKVRGGEKMEEKGREKRKGIWSWGEQS